MNTKPNRTGSPSGVNWPALSPGGGFSSLPSEVQAGSCKRVAAFAWTSVGVWLFALLMNTVVARAFDVDMSWMEAGSSYQAAFNVISGIALTLSGLMIWLAWRLRARKRLLLDLSLGYFVLTAFCVALVTHWELMPRPWNLSWVVFVILTYPSIVPNTPRKILASGLVAATSVPAAVALYLLRAREMPWTAFETAWMVIPPYLAALIAVIPATIIGGLGRQVREARQLGSYRLGELLGRGGMGEVYRAEHRLLARPAAIKLIRPDLLSPGQELSLTERFRREAQAAASLSSPHTIELYDFGVAADGTFYYVMELLDGVDAETLVKRHGMLPPERAAHLLRQAATSLAEAHAKGLVHRDVKPSNVFVARLGLDVDFAKVLDFGLVAMRRGAEAARARLTAPNALAGTPHIMAPEVANGAEPDARADVYALGCLGYWLLTGRPVFQGETPIQIMLKHVRDEPEAPSRRSPFPATRLLDEVILSCLAKRPEDRPRDAGALVDRLDAIRFEAPWTQERARAWWDAHLPERGPLGPCCEGELVPEEMAVA